VTRGWAREFEDPINLPNGRKLLTLRNAGGYITKPSKAEHADGNGKPRGKR
jgi:hypothetical protein